MSAEPSISLPSSTRTSPPTSTRSSLLVWVRFGSSRRRSEAPPSRFCALTLLPSVQHVAERSAAQRSTAQGFEDSLWRQGRRQGARRGLCSPPRAWSGNAAQDRRGQHAASPGEVAGSRSIDAPSLPACDPHVAPHRGISQEGERKSYSLPIIFLTPLRSLSTFNTLHCYDIPLHPFF